ncbi:MAG: hypothetical protein IPG58_19820 [Acidobacteria bacterium]|nr:hypothetical protein [Acidobacteriota bacterium]
MPTFLLIQGIIAPIRKLVIWVKRGLKQNWSPEFRDGHECAFFGYIGKSIRYWDGTKSQTTVFDERLFDRSSNVLPPKRILAPNRYRLFPLSSN